MKRRNEFLTFVTACIPGVGYMYNGLIKKGVQILVLYLLIDPLLSIIGLGFLVHVIKIPFWLYTFFDTYNLAKRVDHGEEVQDWDFKFKKYVDFNNYSENEGNKSVFNAKINKNGWEILGWLLVALGTLALVNRLFITNDMYLYIKSYITQYFVPAIFILLGGFLLIRRK